MQRLKAVTHALASGDTWRRRPSAVVTAFFVCDYSSVGRLTAATDVLTPYCGIDKEAGVRVAKIAPYCRTAVGSWTRWGMRLCDGLRIRLSPSTPRNGLVPLGTNEYHSQSNNNSNLYRVTGSHGVYRRSNGDRRKTHREPAEICQASR